MLANIEQNLSPKEIRTLAYLWKILCNKTRYFSPKTLKEYKELFSVNTFPNKIKADGIELYFTNELNATLRQFVDTIYNYSIFKKHFHYNTIYKSILTELETTINKGYTGQDIKLHLTAISSSLTQSLASRNFYFILNGLKLKEGSPLMLGDAMIFNFEESILTEIIKNRIPDSVNDDFDTLISEFVRKNFFGEVCMRISSFGDTQQAKQVAQLKARLVLNYFRFLSCIFWHEVIHENSIKITMKSETFGQNELFFYQSEPKGSVTLSSGIGRRNPQDIEIDNNLIEECKRDIFFEDFFKFAFKEDKTQMEDIITTAIYWIGEAQADFDREASFLKYWIAIESIFSSGKEEVTKNLCKGVATVLAYTSYGFTEPNCIIKTYSKASKLYKLRSKIVHRGSYQEIIAADLVEICKLSWQTVLGLFELRSKNYTKIAEVQKEINRLFDNHVTR